MREAQDLIRYINSDQKIGLSMSGGATKISGLYGSAEYIMKYCEINPDYITGVSAGAILSLPLAMRKFEYIRPLVTSFELSDFFSQCPVNENGRFTLMAGWNVITGKKYLGKMGTLKKTISRVVTEQEFYEYQRDDSMAEVIVMAVDMLSGARHFKNLKHCGYEEALDYVVASSSIPVFVDSVDRDNLMLYDGGLRDHSISHWLMENRELDRHFSIYSRPKDYDISIPKSEAPDNVLQVMLRTIDVMNMEISKSDQYKEDQVSSRLGINNTQVFLPKVMKSLYDTDKGRIMDLYVKGKKRAKAALKMNN